jgi:hypothetical protein
MFKRTGVFAVAVNSRPRSDVVRIHDFAHSFAQRIAAGQGTLVPVRLYRSMKSTGFSDRHLCTQTGDDFETGEFHVCLDESQFSVSMVL